jgi:MFS family permease
MAGRGHCDPELASVAPRGAMWEQLTQMPLRRSQAGARREKTASLLRHRDFGRLWAGQGISELGSQVSLLAIPLVAVLTLHATTFEVGALTASSTAAFLLIGLPAGAWVDRMRRRTVMIWADLGRAGTFASVPVAAAFGVLTIGQLFAVAFVGGVLTVFFDVAYQSYLPFLVGRQNLVDANSKLQGTSSVATVIGPTAAGGLIQLIRAVNSIAVDAASFVVSVISIWSIRGREPNLAETHERRSLRHEIGEGLSFVLRHPILRAIAGTTSTSNLFSGVQTAVEIVFLVRVLHEPPGIIGLLFGAGSIGGVLGAFMSSRLARLIGGARVTIWAIAVWSVGGLLLPLAVRGAGLTLFALGMFVNAFGSLVYNVNQVSFRQRLCPERLLGRMNATMRFLVWGTLPVGALVGGLLGTSLGVRNSLWISGGGGTLAILWLLFSPLRQVRDFPVEHDDEPAPPRAAALEGNAIA